MKICIKNYWRREDGFLGGLFGGTDSSSSTSNTTQTATGSGTLTVRSPGAVKTGDNSIAVGAQGKYQEAGSLDATGNKGVVNVNDPKELEGIAALFAQTTEQISAQDSAANLASNQGFLQQLGALAESQQTGGLTPVMKTFLWLAAGGLILLALVFGRKH